MKKWSVLLLCIWLIVVGVVAIFELTFKGMDIILPGLGILVGVLLILARKALKEFNPIGLLLLAIWLIVSGAVLIFDLSFNGLPIILGALVIAAGVFIIIGAKKKKIKDWIGALLLAIYLILIGVVALLELSFNGLPIIMACLAIAAGVLLLIKK